MIIREMIADDISELAQLYRQFWNEESCVETMACKFYESAVYSPETYKGFKKKLK